MGNSRSEVCKTSDKVTGTRTIFQKPPKKTHALRADAEVNARSRATAAPGIAPGVTEQ